MPLAKSTVWYAVYYRIVQIFNKVNFWWFGQSNMLTRIKNALDVKFPPLYFWHYNTVYYEYTISYTLICTCNLETHWPALMDFAVLVQLLRGWIQKPTKERGMFWLSDIFSSLYSLLMGICCISDLQPYSSRQLVSSIFTYMLVKSSCTNRIVS